MNEAKKKIGLGLSLFIEFAIFYAVLKNIERLSIFVGQYTEQAFIVELITFLLAWGLIIALSSGLIMLIYKIYY